MSAGRSGDRPYPLIPSRSVNVRAPGVVPVRADPFGGALSCARICYNAPVDVYGIVRPLLREEPSADGDGGQANGALELNS